MYPDLQDDDPVGERHRFGLVMGDIDAGRLERHVQALDLRAHLDPELGIEVGERLVEEEQAGLARDCPADGDALTLAARQLLRPPFEILPYLQDVGSALNHFGDLLACGAAHL